MGSEGLAERWPDYEELAVCWLGCEGLAVLGDVKD